MYIPECITNAVKPTFTDNDYFYGADDMWSRLIHVKDGTVPFISQDMSMLANVMELYYKGLLKASGMTVPRHLIEESHSLVALVDEIESRITPLSGSLSRQDERNRRNFLMDLSDLYIKTRYNHKQATFEEFCKCMIWAEKQKEIVKEILNPPQEETNFSMENTKDDSGKY